MPELRAEERFRGSGRTLRRCLAFGALLAAVGEARAQSPGGAANRSSYVPRPLPPGATIARTWLSIGDHSIDATLVDDLDGDGVSDVALRTTGAPGPHQLSLYSGRTLALFRTHLGAASADDAFGGSFTTIDDLDGDGRRDYVVGAPTEAVGTTPDVGATHGFSGRTGQELFHFAGRWRREHYGAAIAGLGDVDGDGRPELAMMKGNDGARGLVGILDANGALVRLLHATPGWKASLATLDDVTGDGRPDCIEHELDSLNTSRRTSLLDGTTLATRWTIVSGPGSGGAGGFGFSMTVVGDVDGDGTPDLACGEPYADVSGVGRSVGRVHLRSGASGAAIAARDGRADGEWFGYSIARIEDLDGDGLPDLAVGAPGANGDYPANPHGMVRLVSGADLATLAEIDGPVAGNWSSGFFGDRVGAADLDGNGVADLLVLAPFSTARSVNGQEQPAVVVEVVSR